MPDTGITLAAAALLPERIERQKETIQDLRLRLAATAHELQKERTARRGRLHGPDGLVDLRARLEAAQVESSRRAETIRALRALLGTTAIDGGLSGQRDAAAFLAAEVGHLREVLKRIQATLGMATSDAMAVRNVKAILDA